MALVREPAVAGLFYPAAPERLAALVAALMDQAADAAPAAPAPPSPSSTSQPAAPVKALIVPHAGYRYSGPTAAAGYATLAAGAYERVVLLGPCHRVGTPSVALPGAEFFRTPIGDVPVWEEGAAQVGVLPQVVTSPAVHADEHSLEVHLPFIQTVLGPDLPILPLAVGWTDPTGVAEVLESIWGGPETLIVVSSDLSHYLPYAAALRADRTTLDQILAGAPPLSGDQACGASPINGLLEAARRRPLDARLIDYRNSGDTSGDKSGVVGYAAIAFAERSAS
jgi:AmmeMemoRadiSam system protein B